MKSVIAEDLVKTYRNGAVRALDHLSLDVEEGTVLSVLGPNGAGKSTLLSMLANEMKHSDKPIVFKKKTFEEGDTLPYF